MPRIVMALLLCCLGTPCYICLQIIRHKLQPDNMTCSTAVVGWCADLVHSNVRMNGSWVEGDLHLGLLVRGQESRGWEGSKVWPQCSHIQCKLCAHISTVLHLQPLLSLQNSQLIQHRLLLCAHQ